MGFFWKGFIPSLQRLKNKDNEIVFYKVHYCLRCEVFFVCFQVLVAEIKSFFRDFTHDHTLVSCRLCFTRPEKLPDSWLQTMLLEKNKTKTVVMHRNPQHSQWFDWWTPLAGYDLHEFEAAVVQLNVSGIVVLCVDLTRSQWTVVLRLNKEAQTGYGTKVRE